MIKKYAVRRGGGGNKSTPRARFWAQWGGGTGEGKLEKTENGKR